jgi:hypothetical protein
MKKSIFRVCVLTGIVALFLLSCATLPVGFESAEESVVRHTLSGMVFPLRVSGFDRTSFTTYDDIGRDVSVGYRLLQPAHCNFTFYIYPASAELEEHLVELKAMIESHHPGAILVSEAETAHEHSGASYPGMVLAYTYEVMTRVNMGTAIFESSEEVESRAYLFVYEDWFMMYRVTYPLEFRDEIDIYLSSFMERLVWP